MAGTHFDAEGRPRMVDVSAKPESARSASAEGRVRMEAATLARITERSSAKGDVIAIAELAGIMAAKQTGTLIPLCHPIGLDSVVVRVVPDPALPGLIVTAEARTTGRTGVEMEAMTAVSVACLTIYDMLKAVDRGIAIETIQLISKSGGKSGDWQR